MATMTIRTTFALDPATEGAIQRLSALWQVSKAEVVRRSVANAEKEAASQATIPPLAALDWLQSNGTLTEAVVQQWHRDSKRGWEESWKKKAGAITPKPKKK